MKNQIACKMQKLGFPYKRKIWSQGLPPRAFSKGDHGVCPQPRDCRLSLCFLFMGLQAP